MATQLPRSAKPTGYPGTVDDETTDLDLPFRAVYWAHAALKAGARVREFDVRFLAGTQSGKVPLTVGDAWQRNADVHFCLVALAHVVKVCALLPALPTCPDGETLLLLRNFAEHWDDEHGRSGRALDERRFDPMAAGKLFVAEVEYMRDGLNPEVLRWLAEVNRAARALACDDQDPIPEPSDSLS